MAFYKQFSSYLGISGYEVSFLKYIEDILSLSCNNIRYDTFGNLIIKKEAKYPSNKKLLITCHSDEVGIQILCKKENDLYRFKTLGSITPKNLLGQTIVLSNGIKGEIIKEEEIADEKLKVENLLFSTHSTSLKVGDVGTFEAEFKSDNESIVGKALDNRIFCSLLADALISFDNESDVNVYIAFTTQEELGCKGALAALYNIQPDWHLALDTSVIGNRNSVQRSEGVAIKISDAISVCDNAGYLYLEKLLTKLKVHWQFEVSDYGISESAVLFSQRYCRTMGLSIPIENPHSNHSIIANSDVVSANKAVLGVLNNLDEMRSLF